MSKDNPFHTEGLSDDPFADAETYNPFSGSFEKKSTTTMETYHPDFYEEQRKSSSRPDVQLEIKIDDDTPQYSSSSKGKVTITTSDDDNNNGNLEDGTEPSMFSIEYYQRLFNVDTMEVVERCGKSLMPIKSEFIEFTRTKPDLYGPFWIATTLIFLLAVSANISSYFFEPDTWGYNFYVLPIGVGLIYGYTFCIPIPFWLYFKFFGDIEIGIVRMWCVYGYSLIAFIPVSFFLACPRHYIQWAFGAVSLALSSFFLIRNMFRDLDLPEKRLIALICNGVMLLFVIIFSLSVQLIYYQFPRAMTG